MSKWIGQKLSMEIYGASHADKIGVILKGVPVGTVISEKSVQDFLDLRKPKNDVFSTKRKEPDTAHFIKGLNNGIVTGDLEAVIYNENQKSGDYDKLRDIPRPSHADYAARRKFGDNVDLRGGGKFSGRMTAPMCIAGSVAKQQLEKLGITVKAYLSNVGEEAGESYKTKNIVKEDLLNIDDSFPVLNKESEERFREVIKSAQLRGDSVGGRVECVILNAPIGLGDAMFDGAEGKLSELLFGIPAVKGVEFGLGFDFCKSLGSQVNDLFYLDNQVVKTKTNNNGGINGGITNGMPITFGVAFKPTPSISLPQETLNLRTGETENLIIGGRHDACIAVRAVPVVEALAAIFIYDMIL